MDFLVNHFSVSAQNPKRLGIKDERGTFFEMVRILKDRKFTSFVGVKNVKVDFISK